MRLGKFWDGAFDRLLPPSIRTKSRQYWSPLCVARRAALRFSELRARRVLDVGSGPGKFCIAAAFAHSALEFHGVEHRVELVGTSRDLAARLGLRNVQFWAGDALSVPWARFDGFYFYNPFAENMLPAEEAFDALVELSVHRLAADLLGVVEALSSLRTGSIVVTYCGLGGPIPSSFDLISEELVSSGCLRTWIKRRSYEGDWYHLDRQDDVARATRGYVDRRLRHPARSPGRNV
jgi:SAM-dependent methyltransferase